MYYDFKNQSHKINPGNFLSQMYFTLIQIVSPANFIVYFKLSPPQNENKIKLYFLIFFCWTK